MSDVQQSSNSKEKPSTRQCGRLCHNDSTARYNSFTTAHLVKFVRLTVRLLEVVHKVSKRLNTIVRSRVIDGSTKSPTLRCPFRPTKPSCSEALINFFSSSSEASRNVTFIKERSSGATAAVEISGGVDCIVEAAPLF